MKKNKLKVFKVDEEQSKLIERSNINMSKVARNAVLKAAKEVVSAKKGR